MSIFNRFKSKKEKKETSDRKLEAASKGSETSLIYRSNFHIKQTWITEKGGNLGRFRQYVFVVQGDANKPEIRKAVETMYGVKVTGVNILKAKGKSKRLGRSVGKTSGFKKAIVSLAEGQKIDSMVV